MTPNSSGPESSEPNVTFVDIGDELSSSYLDYAMSVIVSRALPDIHDGLKPVHRRILYAMRQGGYTADKPFRKSARIVGDVMGKFHPHGDSPIYDALVRMAQDFSMRLPLIDGQGNFGSMDGDPPAHMRYTEARLAKVAEELLKEIEFETVEFQPNYDGTEQEPRVLPARYPNLLVNGVDGIAVGMATSSPPHNLREIISALLNLVQNPDMTLEQIMRIVPGPDFPTGGIVVGRQGVEEAYRTGRGRILVSGRTSVEPISGNRSAIIIHEVPFQVNKARLVERIAETVRNKIIEGISDLRDESDRDGVRVVVELRRDVIPEVIRNSLMKHTPLQSTISVQMLALDGMEPRTYSLKEAMMAFLTFREQTIIRRTAYQLKESRVRAHAIAGFLIALAHIDDIIHLIRTARDPADAREKLQERAFDPVDVKALLEVLDEAPEHFDENGFYRLTPEQAKAILELRLQRLTGLEVEKLRGESNALRDKIRFLLKIMQDREERKKVLSEELVEIAETYGTPRKTSFEAQEFQHETADLIQREDMIVTITAGGYIKRVPLSTYRAQRRGGKGRSGMTTKEGDEVATLIAASTHTPLLFFTSNGQAFRLMVYDLPVGKPETRGKAIINLLPLNKDNVITAVLAMPEELGQTQQAVVRKNTAAREPGLDLESEDPASDDDTDQKSGSDTLIFVTSLGNIRRNQMGDFADIRSNGKMAMKLRDDEQLVSVSIASPNSDIVLSTRNGMAVRFSVSGARIFSGRSSTGVRGIKLDGKDRVVAMSVLEGGEHSTEDRDAYLAAQMSKRRLESSTGEDRAPEEIERDRQRAAQLRESKFQALARDEQFLFTVTDHGFAQLASAYDYRVSTRGSKGVRSITFSGDRQVVACLLVIPAKDELMLSSDSGQVLRCRLADGFSWRRRGSKGVRIFDLGQGQRLISAVCLAGNEG